MTATDELRRLLDERGVKWIPVAWNPKRETFYHAANGVGFCADEYTDGVKIYTDATITPEQAIAATLGDSDATATRQDVAGTCHNAAPSYLDFLCSECGFVHYHSDENDNGDGNEWRFCPNCGRKVTE